MEMIGYHSALLQFGRSPGRTFNPEFTEFKMKQLPALCRGVERPARFALFGLLLAGLAACSLKPYRIDIQQGNVVTPEQVAQLKPGLTKEQVRFLLGTPLLVDVFHQQRWDYISRYQKGATGEVQTSRVAITFGADNKVEKTEVDPPGLAQGPEAAGPAVAKSRVYDLSVPAKKD
jgi:outer membrane protein assembly factor BamE